MPSSLGSSSSTGAPCTDSCLLRRIAELARQAARVPVASIRIGPATAHATEQAAAIAPDSLHAFCKQLPEDELPCVLDDAVGTHPSRGPDSTLRAVAVVPVHDRLGRWMGTIGVASPQPAALDDDVLAPLETLAQLAGAQFGATDALAALGGGKHEVEQVDHGLVITDLDGRIQWANDGFVQLCGHSFDELIGQRPHTLLQGPATDPATVAAIRKHVQAREGFTAELVNYRKSGEPYWVEIRAEPMVDANGTLTGFIAMETDVSEQKAVEDALRQERQLMATVIDTVEALIVVLDAHGRIVRFNEASRQLTGYSSDEVIGKSILDLLVPADQREAVQALIEAHCTGRKHSSFEGGWVTASGERRRIDWTSTVLTDADGQVQYIIGTGIDVTERHQLEEELLEVSDEERRRIGQDLHDILASHLAGTAMMAKGLRQQRARGRFLAVDDLDALIEQIRQASEQARALSHSLMPAQLKDRTLGEALQQLADNKEALSGISHRVRVEDDGSVLDARTAMHLYRIAYEAINNAIKHAAADTIRVQLYQDEGNMVLRVADDGVGVPVPLNSIRGRGLHMMQHRADAIGADLTVEPAGEAGTVVQCVVPLKAAQGA